MLLGLFGNFECKGYFHIHILRNPLFITLVKVVQTLRLIKDIMNIMYGALLLQFKGYVRNLDCMSILVIVQFRGVLATSMPFSLGFKRFQWQGLSSLKKRRLKRREWHNGKFKVARRTNRIYSQFPWLFIMEYYLY